jgi:predicted Fe-Mo cluster-binding NifX family protein
MKIAVVTDDGTTVSRHFGRARYYAIFSIEEQRVLGKQMFDRSDTLQPTEEHEARHGLAGQIDCHGTGTAAAAAHLRMIQPIEGCEALVSGGMSWSARECLLDAAVRPIVTDIEGLDEAVNAYLDGTIIDHVELLH